jgi:hypothetical protein
MQLNDICFIFYSFLTQDLYHAQVSHSLSDFGTTPALPDTGLPRAQPVNRQPWNAASVA